jgi:hypothetical protein
MRTLVVLFALFVLASPLESKKKDPPKPTQPDIVKGCITVRYIVFQRAGFLHPVGVNISGPITNECAKEGIVTVEAAFFDANGTSLDRQMIEQLVPPNGGPEFQIHPNLPDGAVAAGSKAAQYRNGRITNVSVQFQP